MSDSTATLLSPARPLPPNQPQLDALIDTLAAQKSTWANMAIGAKLGLLRETLPLLDENAQAWADASVRGKQIDRRSQWAGEEWISGPWALAAALNGYIHTLEAVAAGRTPALPAVHTRPSGQVVARVFPWNWSQNLLLNGVTTDVWMQPGVTEANLPEHIAAFYQRPGLHAGAVALVLGAGNINAIPALDTLYKLVADGEVALLKFNPVNDYLAPIFERIFAPFVAGGFLRIITGGAEVGAYLTQHPGIDTIHITGSERTHDAILYGVGDEGATRKARDERLIDKPITSELGGVGAVIVVPGPWSDADIRYQAEQIVTMKFHNSGCNCVAAQVLVLPQNWTRSGDLMDAIREVIRSLPPRVAYYPGAAERQRALLAAHPDAELFGGGANPRTLVANLDATNADEYCFREEFFGPILAQTSLSGATPAEYLHNAVRFANERLRGTLGVNILIHPRSERALGPEFDAAIAALRYGAIGINIWSAAAFLAAEAAWGAYPGHSYADVQSGIGVVHNTFLLDSTEKNVSRGPFYPFPRGILHGSFRLLPRPPWLVTNRTARATTERITHFTIAPRLRQLPGIFLSALRG